MVAQAVASTSRMKLEDWAALAPVDDVAAKQSITLLEEKTQDRPLPAKFTAKATAIGYQHQATSAAQHFLSRSSTPVNGFGTNSNSHSPIKRSGSNPRFPNVNGGIISRSQTPPISLKDAAWKKDIKQPIETHQQFQDWYTRIEGMIEAEQEGDYRRYLEEITGYVEGCDSMLDRLEAARGLLKEMEANYKFVEDNSRALQLACENMLDEQKHLVEVTEAISARLEYFRELERAMRILNLPGETIVLEPDFLELLDRLDVCLDFLKAHRSFKDAEIYLIRFQQCLTRSMTLIKIYFGNVLTEMTNATYDTLHKIATSETQVNETSLRALLYTKFENAAQPTLRMLLYELEKRAKIEPDEYESLLSECWANWFASRNGLLSDNVTSEVRLLDPNNADLIKLTRSGCNYLRSLCNDEWALFKEYFSAAGSSEMYRFLEGLCDNLFDFLRPRILHEQKLEVLCELCNVLQAMMALDIEDDAEEEEEGHQTLADESNDRFDFVISPTRLTPDESVRSPFEFMPTRTSSFAHNFAQIHGQQVRPQPLKNLRFSELLQSILHDVQTRLVFRAQAIIQSDVLHFSPTEADLDFPSKLSKARRMSFWLAEEADGELPDTNRPLETRLPDDETQQTWYPTLQRTLWVLSKLHTYVKTAIFEDFAGEAVTLCKQSLVVASQRIAQKPNAGHLDSQLFTIRHLLILKEMVRSIDLVQIERAADFSSMTDALSNLLRNTSTLFNPSALFQAASRSMPNFAETMKDAKIDLDAALKAVCEDLIVQAGLSLAMPLRSFIQRARLYLDQPTLPGQTDGRAKDLTTQDWATPEAIRQIHDSFVAEGGQGGLEAGMNDLLSKLNLWLSDQRTVAVLIPPIQEEVCEAYNSFYSLVKSEYEFEVSSKLIVPGMVRDRLRVMAASVGASSKKGGL